MSSSDDVTTPGSFKVRSTSARPKMLLDGRKPFSRSILLVVGLTVSPPEPRSSHPPRLPGFGLFRAGPSIGHRAEICESVGSEGCARLGASASGALLPDGVACWPPMRAWRQSAAPRVTSRAAASRVGSCSRLVGGARSLRCCAARCCAGRRAAARSLGARKFRGI